MKNARQPTHCNLSARQQNTILRATANRYRKVKISKEAKLAAAQQQQTRQKCCASFINVPKLLQGYNAPTRKPFSNLYFMSPKTNRAQDAPNMSMGLVGFPLRNRKQRKRYHSTKLQRTTHLELLFVTRSNQHPSHILSGAQPVHCLA